jgi:cytochrome P450
MTDTARHQPTVDLDNTDPTLLPHLFETLNEIREECPVAWSPHFDGFWVLTKYDDVTKAARDYKDFSSAEGIMIPPTGASMKVIPGEVDPPRHSSLRRVAMPFFSEQALQQWLPAIRQIIDDAFAEVVPRGHADLVTDVAHPVPVLVISQILGLLGNDWRRIRSLAAAFLAATGNRQLAREKARELEAYLEEEIEARRGKPPTDILGTLVNSTVNDAPITPAEILGMTQLMVVAGHETTVNGIATMTYRVITEPGLRDRLLADRSLIPDVIAETLRLHPPVWNMARTVVQDTEVRGVEMCPGEKVMLAYGAANRDPDRFPDPETFLVPREDNLHLTFGTGRHRCIGEPLAKIELTLALEYILDNLPDIELDGEPVWGGGTNQHGMRSLPIRFTPPSSPRA